MTKQIIQQCTEIYYNNKKALKLVNDTLVYMESKGISLSSPAPKSNQKALNDLESFLSNPNPLSDYWINDLNLFEILNVSRNELCHSSFLSWVMDPNGSHGLGDSVLKDFLILAVKKNNIDRKTKKKKIRKCCKCGAIVTKAIAYEVINERLTTIAKKKKLPYINEYWCDACFKKTKSFSSKTYPFYKHFSDSDARKLTYSDYITFKPLREKDYKDMRFVSDDSKIMLCIENKIDAVEGDKEVIIKGKKKKEKQTVRYRKELLIEYPDYKRIFVFLTKEGEEGDAACDYENWVSVSYTELIKIIDKHFKAKPKSGKVDKANGYIEEYIREVKKIVFHKDLQDLCKYIYSLHGYAIDLIKKEKLTFQDLMFDALKNNLGKHPVSKNKLSVGLLKRGKANIGFTTANSEILFPKLGKTVNTHGCESIFCFDIKNTKTNLSISIAMNNSKSKIPGSLSKYELDMCENVWNATQDSKWDSSVKSIIKSGKKSIIKSGNMFYSEGLLKGPKSQPLVEGYDDLDIRDYAYFDNRSGKYVIKADIYDKIFYDGPNPKSIMSFVNEFECELMADKYIKSVVIKGHKTWLPPYPP